MRAKLFSHSDSVRGCSEVEGDGGGEGGDRVVRWTREEEVNACQPSGKQDIMKVQMHAAHPDLSADRPPFHTPGGTTGLVSINREKVGGGVMILMRRDTLDSLRNKNKEPSWPVDATFPGTRLQTNVS